MILFVFEGEKAEPIVFDSIRKLYLVSEKVEVVKCKYDLPTLYAKLKTSGYDVFRVLPLQENGIVIPEGVRIDTLFSQIYLFFDYDFQNRMGLDRLNPILEEMLDFFDDETVNGKLYINYPMVESLKYTKELPDSNYCSYVVSRESCMKHEFKSDAEKFAYRKAKGYRFIDLKSTPLEELVENWNHLKFQNVSKAHYIVSGKYSLPQRKDEIEQSLIFDAQKNKYVNPNNEVSILNSFPIFLYDYFK